MTKINYEEYEKIITKMKECVSEYERRVEPNKYVLGLANGDYLNIEIPEENVAHLLGLNIDLLRKESLVKKTASSKEALDCFLDNISYISLKNKYDDQKIESFFSEHIHEKLAAFTYNVAIRPDDIYYIIKYDGEKTYQTEENAEISDYYIIRRSNNKFYVLGLILSTKHRNTYVPVTSRLYENYLDFERFIERIAKKQEITYPYMSKVENMSAGYQSNPYIIRIDDKKVLLDRAIKSANKYDAIASVGKDYLNFVDKSLNRQQTSDNNLAIVRLVTDAIKNNSILTPEEISNVVTNDEYNEDIKSLIDTHNDMLCTSNFGDSKITSNYSTIQDENKSLKEQLQELREQLEKIQNLQQELTKENVELKSQKEISENKINILTEAFQKVQSITDSNKELEKKI